MINRTLETGERIVIQESVSIVGGSFKLFGKIIDSGNLFERATQFETGTKKDCGIIVVTSYFEKDFYQSVDGESSNT